MIIGLIKKIISSVLKAVYKILSVFNLQFALLVMAVGVVLYFCGVFENGGFALLVFCLSFMCSVLAAVFLTQPVQQEVQSSQVQQPIVQPQQVVQPFVQQPVQTTQPTQEYSTPYVNPVPEQPKYFRVKQNPNYVMAEYSNKYELYLITPNGLKLVRTDYKR